jgi:hypothetical protein
LRRPKLSTRKFSAWRRRRRRKKKKKKKKNVNRSVRACVLLLRRQPQYS